MMHYTTFRSIVRLKGWTMDQLLCNSKPSKALLAFITRLGLECYESYLMRLAREERRVSKKARYSLENEP